MLRFEQLDFFSGLVGEAVSFPSLSRPHGKLTASPTTLGRDAELEAAARQLLREVGAHKLVPLVRVEWNPRLRSAAGRATYHRTIVSLNPRLHAHGRAEIDRTLRHELAHLVAQARAGRRRIPPHGEEWRQACRDLGIADEQRCHMLPFRIARRTRRYRYRCPNCTKDFPRVRRIRRAIACLACCRKHSGGRFDRRFQLELIRLSSTSA